MKSATLVSFLFLHLCCFAQRKIDSLLLVNTNYKIEDSTKVVYLSNIFREYTRLNNFEQVDNYGKQAIRIAEKLPDNKSLIRVYLKLGLCYHGKSMYQPAIDVYYKGLEVAKRKNDKSYQANFYVNLGALYNSIPDYAKALEANQQAINLYNELGDVSNINSSYMNIGLIYLDIKNQLLGINYIKKALTNFETSSNGINYGTALANEALGNGYNAATDDELKQLGIDPAERFSTSLFYFNKALRIAETLKDTELESPINNDIGKLYELNGNPKLALVYHQKALAAARSDNNKEYIANSLYSLGNYYLDINDLEAGKTYLYQSLQAGKDIALLSTQKNATEKLSKLYERSGRYDSAYFFYQQYMALRDTIFNQDKEKEFTRQQLKLDFSIKENDYKLAQQLTDNKLREQVLRATQQQQQLLLKQQQLQLINKEKDLQQLAFLKKQSELQNEQQLQAAVMQKNDIQAKLDKNVRDKQIAEQKTQIGIDKKVKIYLAIGVMLAAIISGLVLYNQRKTKRLNKIINEQKLALQESVVVKDKLFSVVSHDVRAPLSSLMSFIDILDNGKIPPEKLAVYAKELKQNLSYTSSLMNNLLNWAASQMQGFKPQYENFDLSLIITEVTNTLQHHLAQKKITVINNIPSGTVINADRNMTAAILRNLISNAGKYSHKEGVVEVSAQKNNDGCLIAVKDEGTGMQAGEIEKFNNPLQQTTESKRGTANEKGTGLGLLLCKTFTEQMGGKISAASNEKGMTFSIWLPIR